jgi:hypothetical protein
LTADVARMACRMAHDDALPYSADTAAAVAEEAA